MGVAQKISHTYHYITIRQTGYRKLAVQLLLFLMRLPLRDAADL